MDSMTKDLEMINKAGDMLEYEERLSKMRRTVDYYRTKYTELLQLYTDLARQHDKVVQKNKRRKKALKEINRGLLGLRHQLTKFETKTEVGHGVRAFFDNREKTEL